jgi:histidinol dehydrogenase
MTAWLPFLRTLSIMQAVAALAYGTETIPAVEKIVGPGNIYVATAKKLANDATLINAPRPDSEALMISARSISGSSLSMLWATA